LTDWIKNLLAVVSILGITAVSMQRIAASKNEALAGAGAVRLDHRQKAEMRVFEELLEQLFDCDESGLAARLRTLQEDGRIWIAPELRRPIRAVFVDSLGLVRRIYLARDELMAPSQALFPQMRVPEGDLRVFAFVTFAGTLQHEIEHYDGVTDEGAAYDREILWYRALSSTAYYRKMAAEDRRVYDWAIDEAVDNAKRARALAGG